jgi:hypothetical protein
MVGFGFGHRGLSKKDAFSETSDFVVPVMKLEPRAVTLFFSNGEPHSTVLSRLPEEVSAGALVVIPCVPDRVCP